MGSCSSTVVSSLICSMTLGENTKKPPLTQAPSPLGFSMKVVTLSPSMTMAPKRPVGCTAVTLASLPCFL